MKAEQKAQEQFGYNNVGQPRVFTDGITWQGGKPSSAQGESQVIEPGQAVDLPAADRARMNRARPGVRTTPERL